MMRLGPGLLIATALYAVTPGGAHAADALLVTPDQMKWGPVPEIPGAQAAVLSGDLSKKEPFVIEIKWPEASKIGPHWHSNTERVTILSGTGSIGMGEAVDPQKGMAMPAGTYAEIEGEGQFDVIFVHPEDDPTKTAASKP